MGTKIASTHKYINANYKLILSHYFIGDSTLLIIGFSIYYLISIIATFVGVVIIVEKLSVGRNKNSLDFIAFNSFSDHRN